MKCLIKDGTEFCRSSRRRKKEEKLRILCAFGHPSAFGPFRENRPAGWVGDLESAIAGQTQLNDKTVRYLFRIKANYSNCCSCNL
jgi:hypothetical protein